MKNHVAFSSEALFIYRCAHKIFTLMIQKLAILFKTVQNSSAFKISSYIDFLYFAKL